MSTLDELYMQRRMALVANAQELTPSMQFDLAASGLTNPELEEAVGHFNPKPQGEGWGFASVFEEMLSREPRKVPVEDLSALQQSLRNQGYLPPDHPADGIWGPDSAAAFGQFDRDNGDQVRAGNSLTAGTIQDGVRLFMTTLPRSVIQGVIGTAKGIGEQMAETETRNPALVGALGYGPGGGVFGFIKGLFDREEDESIWDALTPLDEFKEDPKNLWEDIGLVATIASFIRGGGIAAAGAKSLAPSTLRGSLMALDPVTKPGFVANMLGSAKGAAALGAFAGGAHGLATGDDFGDVVEQAAIGGVGGYAVGASPVGAKLRDLAARYGLKRIQTNPVVKGLSSTFTGGVVINVGGRYAGGFGSGDEDTAIERNIREAPVVLPEWADTIGGMVLLPNRMFPASLGEIGTAARKMAGENRLFPYFHALETAKDAAGRVLSKSKVNQTVRDITPEQDLWTREQYGIGQLTKWSMEARKVEEGPDFFARADIEGLYRDAHNDIMTWYKTGTPEEMAGKKNLLMSLSTEDSHDYANYLVKLEQKGSGVREWGRYEPAQLQAENLALAAREGNLEYSLGRAPTQNTTPGPTMGSTGMVSEEVSTQRLRNIIREVDAEDLESTDPVKRSQGLFRLIASTMPEQEARMLGKELNQLSIEDRLRRLEDMVPPEAERAFLREVQESATTTLTKPDSTLNFVAADPRYMTQQDWESAADEYVSLKESARRAWDSADSIGDDIALAEQKRVALLAAADANDELNTFVRSFRDPLNPHRSLPEKVVDMAIAGDRAGRGDAATYKFADFLREKASHAGSDVTVPDEFLGPITDNGYKLIATKENMRFLGEVKELAAVHNVGDYTRRAQFFEAAGLSPYNATEKEIGRLKEAHMEGNLNQVMAELGINLPGGDATAKLVNKMHSLNNGGLKHGPFVTTAGDKALVRRTKLLKVDLRQLKLDDIVDALGLDSGVYTQVDDPFEVARRVKDAIHKGSSFGSEVSVRNPVDSARMLMSALRVEGLTGASDFMRQFHIQSPARAVTIGGGVVGASIGAQEEGLSGAIKGGIAGSLALGTAAYGGRAFLKQWPNKSPFKPNTYGWLPNNLHNASMALRYSLSFTFDLGRRMEQAQIASMKYGMPVVLAPKSWAKRNLAEDFGGNPEQVMPSLRAQLDEVMGSRSAMNADDMDRRAAAIGLTGFSQRDADAVYAHLMIKSGRFKPMQVRDAVHSLGHYPARAGAERSLNFVLFPFSFQKKFLTTLGDFMLAEPARALLVHEGMRQWYQAREGDETMSSRFAEITEKYLPLAREIGRLNNLSYGISPGRFFMEGFTNNKTLLGKVGQSLAAVFTPSGATTPLQQAAGKAGDQMVHLFSPILLTGEDTENFIGIFEDFAPAVRDVRNLALGHGENQPSVISQQVTAATSPEAVRKGGGGAPWYQLRAFNNERRQLKADYEDLATAFGYTTVDGFLNSEMGAPYKADIEARTMELVDKYPTGAAKSQYFETSTLLDDKARAELLADPNRTPAEEMIAQLIEMENEADQMAQMLQLDSSEMLPRLTEDIRSIAVNWYDDVRFRTLYDRFFKYRYGPIAETAVA